jgi:tRNA-dihydrouridine synthase A
MCDAVDIDISVKHRIGIDDVDTYGFVRDFVGTVAEAGCKIFIVHARNAILKGLSPKENREIPPLKYDFVYQLKRDFPELEIIINGGVRTVEEIDEHLKHLDGVMIGREAYHNPWLLSVFDERYYGDAPQPKSRLQVVESMLPYIEAQVATGGPRMNSIVRHMLGLMSGLRGARLFRQQMSDSKVLACGDANLLLQAAQAIELA